MGVGYGLALGLGEEVRNGNQDNCREVGVVLGFLLTYYILRSNLRKYETRELAMVYHPNKAM